MSALQPAFVPLSTHLGFTRKAARIRACRKRRRASLNTQRQHLFDSHRVKCQYSGVESNDEASAQFRKLEADIRDYLETNPEPGPNPLAYINLGKAGRTDLISRIMDAGGYIEVSRRLGIPVDESQFIPAPKIPDSSSQSLFQTADDGATIAIGRDLEARLDSAEEVLRASANADLSPADANSRVFRNRDVVPSAQEIVLENESMVPPVVDEPIPMDERFVLTNGMRIGMLLLVATVAVGYGRVSTGVVSNEVITVARSVAQALGVAHVVVAIYAGAILAPQLNRNSLLWALKALLSGPAGVRQLRSLGPLQ